MARGRRGGTLERWEVAIIKAMLGRGGYNDQEVLSYFTRPTRSINHRVISEIRKEEKHRALRPATEEALNEFLAAWPDIDPGTGLHRSGDELLLKAREAMIAAVHIFNSAGLTFRAELFIVTSIIAWTYFLHAWFRKEGIDYRYMNTDGVPETTREGGEKYWELSKCLNQQRCPLSPGVKRNLSFLLEIRHEIEHRSTSRIDDAISAKLQACCINFNDAIKNLFGGQYGLEKRLPIALQFVTFDATQRSGLKRARTLPANIAAMMQNFEENLADEDRADLAYAYRVVFVPKLANRPSGADEAIEFVRGDSEEGMAINRVLLKEVDRPRYTATQIVEQMHEDGFARFSVGAHTRLWQELDAKNPGKNFGLAGDYRNTWVWRQSWLERVRAHCQEQGDRYR
ncbi:MAG: DUF3644 domain-containing protein [Pseudomonadota bacterium]|jgi:hypothetical protein